ncbi:hypothetical protein HMPREF9374_3335 [Desmospora sp. 8437]|nr:hypothetical protein HMPREF9374_3335 [Desmospora sp. 8437]
MHRIFFSFGAGEQSWIGEAIYMDGGGDHSLFPLRTVCYT